MTYSMMNLPRHAAFALALAALPTAGCGGMDSAGSFADEGGQGGGGAGVGSTSAGASATSQRTLTVIIKFDSDDRVRDFSYHSSRF